MRTLGYLFVAIVAFAVSVLANAPAVPFPLIRNDAPALEITTSIRPVSADTYQLLRVKPGTYRCSALIHDEPGSRRVWAPKDILIGPGESGDTSSAFGNLSVTFHAEVASTLDRAETRVTITRDGKIVSRQSSTVWLQR